VSLTAKYIAITSAIASVRVGISIIEIGQQISSASQCLP